MVAASELIPKVPVRTACAALGVERATFYRRRHQKKDKSAARPRPAPPRTLSQPERDEVLQTLDSPRFCDTAPAEVHATLLDEGQYLCSPRTMYRLLDQHDQVKERRRQLRHPAYAKPELLATAPNQLWTWDTTKLKGPAKWTYYYLMVILDVYSRYVVGWMIAERESGALAQKLISETIGKYDLDPTKLVVHADRGPAQTSKDVAFLLADLGVTKSHSRPYTSADNPYSEAQFKTLKYCSTFPQRFGSPTDVRGFCTEFFAWFNDEHRHSGIGFLTPHDVHFGLAEQRYEQRKDVLLAAYAAHPERFVKGQPRPPALPTAAWINRPSEEVIAQ